MKLMEDFFKSVFNETLKEIRVHDRFLNFTEKFGVVQLVARQDLVLSGIPSFQSCLNCIDPNINYEEFFASGQEVLCGQSVFQLDGNLISILKIQTTGLNLLELFSGIATQTKKFVKACQKSQTQILNRCKPVPGYKPWYRQAMEDGGAVEQPISIKNCLIVDQNHIRMAGGLKEAVISSRNHGYSSVSVEVKNPEEVKTACKLGVNHIQFKVANSLSIKEELKSVPENIKTEIRGVVSLEKISEILELEVDFINIESLTHSFNPVSFEMVFNER